MDIEYIRKYCLAKKSCTESFPFGDEVLVFKVENKIFLLAKLDGAPLVISLKADPEQAVEWRERYDAVQPAWHMNKKHWNMVRLDGSVPLLIVQGMIDDSYQLVVQSLPAALRKKLQQ